MKRWAAFFLAIGHLTALGQARVPPYPGSRGVSLAPGLEAGGDWIEASYFVTPDPMPEVARFYVTLWKGRGYLVAVEASGEGNEDGLVVSALLTLEAQQLAVVLRRHQGQTLGFRVQRALSRWPTASPPVLEATLVGAALPEGSVRVFPGAPEQVWRTRVAHWVGEGFRFRSGTPGAGVTWLERGAERLRLVTAPFGDTKTAVLEQRSKNGEAR